ncbi:MAG TPA: DUF2914 domain-containing protein [Syntrophobacteraceae bacterium]|nr:DUF2914 domain-containing protein [Syntrophobacteraceae bacterium]HBZ55561.1 DUF2914 domain-containing protein [Syntrophobacteraceae bacterium]
MGMPTQMLTRVAKLLLMLFLFMACPSLAADPTDSVPASGKEKVAKDPEVSLVEAVMCESVQNLKPVNEALTFSVALGHVYCVSVFKPASKATVIYHRWYRRNELSTQIRLKIYPPHWTAYSVIQLRVEDKGPWHIEVADQNGKVYETLRFSITD